jgi:CheY-like chemotaxis protein
MKPILQVEDEENDVLFLEIAARKAAIRNPLRLARNAAEAIDYLNGVGRFSDREQFPLPCLLMLDLNMPGTSGFEVLKYVREHEEFRCIVVLVFTSSGREDDVETAYRLGANSYIVKPANPGELLHIMSTINAYWLGVNRFTERYQPMTRSSAA